MNKIDKINIEINEETSRIYKEFKPTKRDVKIFKITSAASPKTSLAEGRYYSNLYGTIYGTQMASRTKPQHVKNKIQKTSTQDGHNVNKRILRPQHRTFRQF